MRILGLDYGSKTVSAAISDPLGITAQGVETIWRKQENHRARHLPVLKNLFRISRGEDRLWISEEHEQYDWRTCPKITGI